MNFEPDAVSISTQSTKMGVDLRLKLNKNILNAFKIKPPCKSTTINLRRHEV